MAELALSYMYGTWVWVETVGQYFTVCLCPQKGGNQGALPPGPPLLRRAFSRGELATLGRSPRAGAGNQSGGGGCAPA